ncbi:hypothetical protein [Bradyrhizobium sp. SZCCHNPS2010]|uniref:hypothetical protein n=1 Tax=Bradyrhizobium sp. SZCCHNPS2010 TaxID=3057333 RepID=UPI002915DCA1|nr:hypothetical protein [Bradyrhizobium sp. SZCCHNPS2010]
MRAAITGLLSKNWYLVTAFVNCGKSLPQFKRFARWFKALGVVGWGDCLPEKRPH